MTRTPKWSFIAFVGINRYKAPAFLFICLNHIQCSKQSAAILFGGGGHSIGRFGAMKGVTPIFSRWW